MIVRRVAAAAEAREICWTGSAAAAPKNKRIRFELYVSAQNLLNHANPIGYSGVVTSPFFGQPTAAMPGRRLDLGMRIGF